MAELLANLFTYIVFFFIIFSLLLYKKKCCHLKKKINIMNHSNNKSDEFFIYFIFCFAVSKLFIVFIFSLNICCVGKVKGALNWR